MGVPEWTRVNPSKMLEAYRQTDVAWNLAIQGYQATEGCPISCAPGCNDCCTAEKKNTAWGAKGFVEMTFTPAEAVVLFNALRGLPKHIQEKVVYWNQRLWLGRGCQGGAYKKCPLLCQDGKCLVHHARPVVCRTYGLPVMMYQKVVDREFLYSLGCPKNPVKSPLPTSPHEKAYDESTGPEWALHWIRAVKELIQIRDEDDLEHGTAVDLSAVIGSLKR